MTDKALEMLNSWKDGEVRDVHQDMMHLTMRIVSAVLFNTSIAEEETVATALNVLMAQLQSRRMLLPGLVRHIPLPTVLRARKAVRQLDKTFTASSGRGGREITTAATFSRFFCSHNTKTELARRTGNFATRSWHSTGQS